VVACLPLDPRIAGSLLDEVDGFLTAIKIRSTTSFGGEVKPSVPYREILRHVKKTVRVMEEILRRKNSTATSRQVSPASLLAVSAGNARELRWTNQE
jgi:hypothetical protein